MSLLLWKPTLYVERLQNCLPGYFFRLYNCNSLCLHRRGIPDPWPDRIWASSGHILKASCLSCARSPRAEHSTPSGVSPEQRDKITSLDLLATPLLMQSEIWLTFWATSAHDWLRIIFHAPIFPSPSQDCFASIWLPVCVNIAGYPDPGVYFALGFSKLHEASRTQLSRQSRYDLDGIPSLLWINYTTQFGFILNHAEGALIPSMSLMKMLNSTGPRIDPWGTPLITGFHLDLEALPDTSWCTLRCKS